jgi:hypothetical protein
MNAPYDVVAAGAANAALCALSAREQGARVLVLERAPHEQCGRNCVFVRLLSIQLSRRLGPAKRFGIRVNRG